MKKSIVIFILLFLIVLPFHAFADEISWLDCVKEALQNNYSLISAKESLNQIRAQSWYAASSAFPQISASVSGSKNGNEDGINSVPYVGNQYSQSYSYGLSARQLIFDGFKNTQDILKSSEDVKAAELNYKAASAVVRFNLKQAYNSLMKAQKMVEITDKIMKLRKKQFDNVKLRYNAGRENKGAVLNSEADYNQAEFETGQAVRMLELSQEKLCGTLGRAIKSGILVKEDYALSEDVSAEPDFNSLINNKLDLLIAVSKRKSSEFSFGSSVSAYFPQISLSGSVGRSAKTLWPQDTNWSLGLNISFSIFDGGRTEAQSMAALAALNQAKANEKAAIDSALTDIKSAWYDFKDSYLSLNVQKKYFESSQERAKIADAQYSTGLVDFNNWTIIQNSLVSSQKLIVSSQIGLLTAEAAWVQAKGGTLEDETK